MARFADASGAAVHRRHHAFDIWHDPRQVRRLASTTKPQSRANETNYGIRKHAQGKETHYDPQKTSHSSADGSIT